MVDFSNLAGERIDGGCDHCDAYQTVDQVAPGVWSMVVHHDDWCPWLRRRQGRQGAN